MRQRIRTAAKRCGLVALALSLLFAAMPAAHGIVAQPGDMVMIINPEAPTFALSGSAVYSETGIATYNNGVVGYVMDADNGMVEVRVGGAWDAMDGVIGYVPERYLTYADAGMPVDASLPVAELRPADGQDAVMLRSGPHDTDREGGPFPAGTQVEVLGEMLSCYQVQFGNVVGFVPKQAVQMIAKQAMFGYSVTRDGFARVDIPEDIRERTWEIPVYSFPDDTSFTDSSTYHGETISLLHSLGEWAQVRTSNGAVGFIHTSYLTPYLLADMVAATASTYAAGSYTVGSDLPPGLYTLDVPAGGRGGIEAMGQGTGAYHNYYADDAATFAMYLTAPMTVEIYDQAILSPMDTSRKIGVDIGWEYSGNGRFFCGVQLLSHWVFMYEVRLLPGESVGYIVRTNLSQETGEGERPTRYYLTPGETEYVFMTQGEFIEFRNCEIVGRRGNG